jgi:hypothetical protein
MRTRKDKRRYSAPPEHDRCRWDITLPGDGSGAQCMRRRMVGQLCTQHAKMYAAWSCEYCGGNDEFPPEHCMDCTRPAPAGPGMGE